MLIHFRRQIVDFTIWQIFKNGTKSGTRPQHLLCQGFRRDVTFNGINRDENPVTAIPGVVSTYPNQHISMLKVSPWPQILALMGKEGQRMMIDLILDCGIYVAVESGYGNYFQLSG
jgi:telomerase reverse transcriptase